MAFQGSQAVTASSPEEEKLNPQFSYQKQSTFSDFSDFIRDDRILAHLLIRLKMYVHFFAHAGLSASSPFGTNSFFQWTAEKSSVVREKPRRCTN